MLKPAGCGVLGAMISKPLTPERRRCQSMPRWYSLRSCTSATVASISTWRFAPASTWSRNSWTFSCWAEVART